MQPPGREGVRKANQNEHWRGGIPVVVDVALPGAKPGLPDHFFFLPAGRQSGTVRPLPLHHRHLLLPNVRTARSALVGEEELPHTGGGGGASGGAATRADQQRTSLTLR